LGLSDSERVAPSAAAVQMPHSPTTSFRRAANYTRAPNARQYSRRVIAGIVRKCPVLGRAGGGAALLLVQIFKHLIGA
jgi:hypothetical protein